MKRGDKQGQATSAVNLGLLALDRDRPTEAHAWFERALSLARQVGQQNLVADTQYGLARVLEKGDRHAEALPLAQAALQTRERLRDRDLEVTRQLVERLRNLVSKYSFPLIRS
jgi:tetratricopeptide (TPR) repeat protein